MFLRTSIFALFLTSFQLQAADSAQHNTVASKRGDELKLEIGLCVPDCPNEILSIIDTYRRSLFPRVPYMVGNILCGYIIYVPIKKVPIKDKNCTKDENRIFDDCIKNCIEYIEKYTEYTEASHTITVVFEKLCSSKGIPFVIVEKAKLRASTISA